MTEFPAWQQGIRQEYPPLRGLCRVDAVVVGGGLTGVTAALMLSENGVRTALVEARALAEGATAGCAGMVTCQAIHALTTAARVRETAEVRAFAQLTREAVAGVVELAQRLPQPCGVTACDAYAFAETEDDLPALRQLMALEMQLGLPVTEGADAGGCPFPVERSAFMRHQGLLAPLPYVLGMAEAAVRLGCRIYEQSPVRRLEGHRLTTPQGVVEASWVILCTGAPLDCHDRSLLALMAPRLRELRLLTSAAPLHSAQLSVHSDEMTLRPCQEGLLMTWDRGAYGTDQADGTALIRDRTLRALLPESETRQVILRREIFSRDGLPLVGPLHPRDSRLMMATGFGGLGLTGSFLAARLLTGAVIGRPLPESPLFLPFRRYPGRGAFDRAALLASAKAYLHGLTSPGTPRCPHMGCPLRYNADSGLWECPCHGSSFDILGQVEAAPAIRDAALSPRDRP